MTLPVEPPIQPMLAELQKEIPKGDGWRYEPKWDGFRAIIYREGDRVHLSSRKNQPLERYFPELVAAVKVAFPERCVIDGEIIIPGPLGLDFEALSQRIHPAASRVQKLSVETPTHFVAFDILALGEKNVMGKPFDERRRMLEQAVKFDEKIYLTPQTDDPDIAARWFTDYEGAGLDGVIAKRVEILYEPGDRVMVKIKHRRTVDCVVGGYRMLASGVGVGSLLLGLYDKHGVLHHVGHTSSFNATEKRQLLEMLKPIEGGESFGKGRTPGGPSRWNSDKDSSWTPLKPLIVCEVSFDYLQGDRFRHAATFIRWRGDKPPLECTYDQLIPPKPFKLEKVFRAGANES